MPFPQTATTRPLAEDERNWLRANVVLPVAFVAVMVAILAGMSMLLVWPLWDRPLLKVFAGAEALLFAGLAWAVWMHVGNNRGDLADGVAQVRRGRVVARRRTGRAPHSYYLTIEGAGEVIVMGDVYERVADGTVCVVAFSPRTRKAWTVD